MGDNTTKVVRDITNTPIHVPDGKGEIDMCKAVKDMIDESKTEGIATGIATGELNKAKKMSRQQLGH